MGYILIYKIDDYPDCGGGVEYEIYTGSCETIYSLQEEVEERINILLKDGRIHIEDMELREVGDPIDIEVIEKVTLARVGL